jgi:Flp pilus assembly pilin Flp
MKVLKRIRREEGQTASEYAVVLGVITTGIVLALTNLSGATQAAIERVVSLFP